MAMDELFQWEKVKFNLFFQAMCGVNFFSFLLTSVSLMQQVMMNLWARFHFSNLPFLEHLISVNIHFLIRDVHKWRSTFWPPPPLVTLLCSRAFVMFSQKIPFPLGVWRHYIHCSGAAYEWMTSRSKTGECVKRLLPGDLSFSLEKNHLRMTSNFYICFSREPSTSRWSSCRSSPNSDSIALFSLSARQWEIFSSTEQLVYLVGHIFLL